MGGDSAQIPSPVLQKARGLGIDAANHVKHCGFAGAIRTNQCQDLTRVDIKTHIVDRQQSAELTGDILGAQQGLCHDKVEGLTQTV